MFLPLQWVEHTLLVDALAGSPQIASTDYVLGGLIPMIPYFAMQNVTHALFVSIGITAVMLTVFGFIKNWFMVGTKQSGLYGAVQTLGVGTLAAGASYGIARAIDSKHSVDT